MDQHVHDEPHCPFEGPEKLLEIWFKPSPEDVPDASEAAQGKKTGLRKVDRKVWEEMLDIVKCQVLSAVEGTEMDAYLLSESSFFVAPHRLILKTCGTTLNLLGLPRILEIAATHAKMPDVYRCFYSRKAFMFPDRQLGPHRDWKQEIEYLDNIFKNGTAYTVGKVNGDHWLLYLTNPLDMPIQDAFQHSANQKLAPEQITLPDYTIEILMSDLSAPARGPFFSQLSPSDDPHAHAALLSSKLGISDIFPPQLSTLDAFSFSPCGYSANALVKWGDDQSILAGSLREGYYTIHVTPEEGWSYASFECNVPSHSSKSTNTVPDLQTLVQRVVDIFQPGRLSLTLFISKEGDDMDQGETVEAAQHAFKLALTNRSRKDDNSFPCSASCYYRTDKINYEFGGYDLAFASFQKIG